MLRDTLVRSVIDVFIWELCLSGDCLVVFSRSCGSELYSQKDATGMVDTPLAS